MENRVSKFLRKEIHLIFYASPNHWKEINAHRKMMTQKKIRIKKKSSLSVFTNTLNVSFLGNTFIVEKNRNIILSLPVKDKIVGHILIEKYERVSTGLRI